MNKIISVAVILVFSLIDAFAQFYPVSSLPDSLKSNASVVVRSETRTVEMKSSNSGKEKIVKILTILNKQGEDLSYMRLYYDKNSTVKINDIIFYNSLGEKIKSAKQSEIIDSPVYRSLLFSETRLKSYYAQHPVYPYTIVYDYELTLNNIISIATWSPIPNYYISVQHSKFSIIHPKDVKINIKEVDIKPANTEYHSDLVTQSWEINNIKAIEEEPYEISFFERIPLVYLMPSILTYEKHIGIADNWIDCGKWFYGLYEERDEIAETEKLKVAEIIKDIPDTINKIRALYKYMQQNTHYIAVIMGLGGYQPFDAKTVFETGYGDCKALSNYMHALLKYAGIKSFPARVSSGTYKEPIFRDFPNFQQFDHIILCVPQRHDTIWLECTSQTMPFGFLGDFTDDRDVMLITEQGGKFAHTKRYGADENIRSCTSEFSIDSTGTASCKMKSYYFGLQYDDISQLFNSNYDEQKKWLYSESDLPSLQIKDFSISEHKNINPSATISESVISKNYCSFSGKYMLLPLNLLNAQTAVQKMLKPRLSDILISRDYVDYDTIIYKIPKNFSYESLPAGKTINSIYGSYSYSVKANDSEIVFIRKFVLLEGRYKPAMYKELYDFMLAVSKADNSKIMLTKKI